MQLDNTRRFLILLLLTVLSTAAISFGGGILRTAAALLMIFALPGYAVLAAWFPDRIDNPANRVLFTIILSATLTGLGGLVLHFTLGIQSVTWVLWLAALTIIHGGIAFVRGARRRLTFSDTDPFEPLNGKQIVVIGAAVLIAFGAINIARTGVIEQPRPGFTQLWLLQDAADPENRVRIGIHNQENAHLVYRLVLSAGSVPITDEEVIIEAGQTWESWLPISADTMQPIRADLYRLDQPNHVYRSAEVWLTGQQ